MAKTQAPYDDGDGASAVTAYTDADGGIVPAGVAAYVAAGVAAPVDAAHPLPVVLPAEAATEATTAAIAEGLGAPGDAAAGTDTRPHPPLEDSWRPPPLRGGGQARAPLGFG